MNQLIHVAQAGLPELPCIQQLAETTWKACYPGVISEGQIRYMLDRGYSLEALQKEITQDRVQFVLAQADGEPAGFGSHGPTDTEGEAKLHKLYVHPDQQRRGIGARIVDYISKQLRTEGHHTLTLAVNKRNTQAIEAYHKYGFTHRASVVVDIGNGYVMDDYILALEL